MTQRNSHRRNYRTARLALAGLVARIEGLALALVLVLLITTGGAG